MSRRYKVRYDEDAVFSAGLTKADEQVIVGPHPNGTLVAALFSAEGDFLRLENRSPGSTELQSIWDDLTRWKEEIGFRPAAVIVNRFSLPYEGIGIDDLPESMRHYLEQAPDEGDPEYQEGLYEEIESFIQGGSFVFWWCGKNFWMSQEGEITDS